MLQVNFIKENKEQVIAAMAKRNFDATEQIETLLETNQKRRTIQHQAEELQAKSNKIAKEIGQLFKSGKKEEAEAIRAETSQLKEELKTLATKQNELEQAEYDILFNLPNMPQASVPAGKSDADNVMLSEHGSKPKLHKNAIPHWDLANQYNLIDFELGVKITGAGFPVYVNKGARLQRALVNYFLDKNTSAGYTEYQPPIFINEESGIGTGQLPDKEGQMYQITADKLYAIPTAEVPVTNMFRNVIVNRAELPIKCTAFTPCFRREAGSYGKDVRGLNRLHQFDKVEIVSITDAQSSNQMLDEMVQHVASILTDLKLPYRILRLCGGDLGFASAITYDFEVWSAAQEKWLEVSSVSNFETFQSNRLKLRYKDENNKKHLAHTLNGSAMALPRILAALLENNQTEDGITIPEILVPYTGFDSIK